MNNRWTFPILLLLVTLGAIAFRLPRLSERPFHGDEAIHAYKFNELLETNSFIYDPDEYHGPTLHYFTLPVVWLTGTTYADSTEATFRIVPAIFGAGLILLLWITRDSLGRWATVWAALFTAISTAMVFYSRYYIQEMLLVFFIFAAIACGYRYIRNPRAGWAIACAIALGLAHATKETWVISGACMFAALCAVWAWQRLTDRHHPTPGQSEAPPRILHLLRWKALLPAALIGALVSATFLTGFFTNPRGAADSILTYRTYLGRGTKTADHDHPWYYYLDILTYWRYAQHPGIIERTLTQWKGEPVKPRPAGRAPGWSEGLILGLAVVGFAASFRRGTGASPVHGEENTGKVPVPRSSNPWFLRFLALYTLLMILFYSAIPYKTPWCMLNFLHGLILLAGIGAAALIRWARYLPLRILLTIALLAGASQLAWQAYRSNYIYHSDLRLNPLVYSHPTKTIRDLIQRLEELAQIHPKKHNMLVQVFATGDDYWPLPYYWRRFQRIGFAPQLNDHPDSDVVIVSPDLAAQLNTALKGRYANPDYYGLRPGKTLVVYVQSDLWKAFLRTRGGE